MSTLTDKLQARCKVTVYKPLENPDNRTSFCGAPFLFDENGRQYAIIPAHCAEGHKPLFPTYEFSEEYEVKDGETPAPKKPGRPKK